MDSKVTGDAKVGASQIGQLTIDHFLGAFFVYSMLFAWALLHFVLEIYTHKRITNPPVGRFWVLSHIFHDNKRYEWVFGDELKEINPKFLTNFLIVFYTIYLIAIMLSLL